MMMSNLDNKLAEIDRRYRELDHLLSDPAVATDPGKLQEYGRERAELEEIVAAYEEYRGIERSLTETQALAEDEDQEIAALAADELRSLRASRDEVLARIKQLLVPKDPNDEKNVIV